ncbi:MAG: SDR family NAD(P)-dependent oxidoreductase [Thermaerobacter sp.]|nr:SDR family NAD(P)-dependent oxidoreductase [Thermaerobacter sp.]
MGEWEVLEAVPLPREEVELGEGVASAPRLRLQDRVAVITGGNGGLGLAAAAAFAREGAHLVLAARSEESLANAASSLKEHGVETLAVPTDVGSPEQVERLFDRALREFGQVDILVNNAGVSGPTAPLHEISVEDWERTLSVDLTSAFLCAKAVLPGMMQRGRGNILNVSSIFGKRAYPYRTPYAAAKWALIGLTQSLAHEVGRYGVRVNAICPGPIAGERIERVWRERAHRRGIPFEAIRDKMVRMAALRRIPEAEEFADLALFLVSDASRGMTGQALNISGGMEMR